MSRIRVMIVEDSRVVRQFLEHLIERDPRLEVVASVGSAESALRMMDRASPDVISMDIQLPGMNGFEATQRIMSERPTPIVVIAASVQTGDLNMAMNALRAGALAVVEKPPGLNHGEYQARAQQICTQLAIMSQVKVVRQRFRNGSLYRSPKTSTISLSPSFAPTDSSRHPERMVGVVASTGGPKALESILRKLPADFPFPILLVQHMTTGFMEGFVQWLNGVCALRVELARDGQRAQPGCVHVAPDDRHLRLDGRHLRLDDGEPICMQRPSGTALLESMAGSLGENAVGVVLTGMGTDGAEGLLQMRRAGAHTMTEDASTAVVFGMPKAAVELGASCESLPLGQIAARLLSMHALSEVI
ncbi:MAG: chemotaxis-specific protein-glutamate methyltransferase CheB [Phycisphaeraceae bacterium]